MPYVDSHGRVHASPPLLQRLVLALHSLYLAVALFLSTLFSIGGDATSEGPEVAIGGPSVMFNPRGGGCGPCGGVQM
ncbi:hypothetical protein Rhopal_004511-T1 [Rhodotorula paludigena]|uniref:Transmembrane protein n=1 Tax=Rhodotorula paludigena TaxID=86838 RepID=A0AAV5GMR4_9BASI|nr:hypothetical protein Rhopal_004511-T1 [Rhodotorula paludigena]